MCQRRSGFRWMDSAEDVFRRMKRLELESTELDKSYEIFYGAHDDEVWMKRLFSPKFIVWLSEAAPQGVAFECVGRQPLRQPQGPPRQRRRPRRHVQRRRRDRPPARRRDRADLAAR